MNFKEERNSYLYYKNLDLRTFIVKVRVGDAYRMTQLEYAFGHFDND